jgi:mitochondrial chaperone BCS1
LPDTSQENETKPIIEDDNTLEDESDLANDKPPTCKSESSLESQSSETAASVTPFSKKHQISNFSKPSRTQVEQLAERFAAALPEREFSMASLQGYLMDYKTRPTLAVSNLTAWVQEKREQNETKAKLRQSRAKKAKKTKGTSAEANEE